MTFEKILTDLSMNLITAKQAYDEICKKDKMRTIQHYANIKNITSEEMKDGQLVELQAIVGILQMLYNSGIGSPISDSIYDTLQEELVDMGIPRLTGTVEINDAVKVGHRYPQLRGTLDKVYYLTSDEPRTNKSRRTLDEWIKSTENKYYKVTGKRIDLNNVRILVQPKFDGVSAVQEIEKKPVWITRGDTRTNKASDVSHIMHIFNTIYSDEPEGTGIKYEVMMTEENKDKINKLYRQKQYKNSRQIVTSIFNTNEADFKCDYLYPIPLRIIHKGDEMESIHPDLIDKFPVMECTFGDRELIRQFALHNKYVSNGGMRFRTDGAVMTILDKNICRVLGRENDINQFEVAYKFTEEVAYTKVRDVEFYVSEFGFVTPVLVVNDVIMKGNTINHISLSTKERFDELNLHIGDTVKVLYDIIPYAVIDETCPRTLHGRKIEFTKVCPMCHHKLELDNVVRVQCSNPKCPSVKIGRLLNYCTGVGIKNIGWSTLHTLYEVDLLDDGILSLYKLKKHQNLIENMEGFGIAKTKKIIAEIEAKRRLQDYDFFGSIGILTLGSKSFQSIFKKIRLQEFIDMIRLKNFDLMYAKVTTIPGIGDSKAKVLIEYFKDEKNRKKLMKLLKEVKLFETYGREATKGRIVFSGCRPSSEMSSYLRQHGWDVSSSWSNKASYLVIPSENFTSSKVDNAKSRNVPIISLEKDRSDIEVLKEKISNLE